METPFYRYDLSLLRQTLQTAVKASSIIPSCKIHYAVKANCNPEILREVAAAGIGADCVSAGEIMQALQAGINPRDIVYSGVAKTDSEIILAMEKGIGCLNVESLEELRVISSLAVKAGRSVRVALRVNPDVDAHTHSNITTGLAENKFGINMEMVPGAVDAALSLGGIDFHGLHFHIGSQILDMDVFAALCEKINSLQEFLSSRGVKLHSIDVGGGLGVDYQNPDENPVADFESYFQTFARNLRLQPGQEFHCEPGRSLVAQCGTLVSRCIYVKQGTRKKFVILDAGMNDLIRPALYQAYHKIDNLSNPMAETEVYDVVGPVCESSDTFAEDRALPRTTRGDIIAIRSAGAYGESMASTYNSRPLPQSEFV